MENDKNWYVEKWEDGRPVGYLCEDGHYHDHRDFWSEDEAYCRAKREADYQPEEEYGHTHFEVGEANAIGADDVLYTMYNDENGHFHSIAGELA